MLQDFFLISSIQIDNDTASVSGAFNETHPVFLGHFPKLPIVPGACLIETTSELFSQIIGKKVSVFRAKNVKFLQVIYPNRQDEVTFSFVWEESDGNYDLRCTVSRSDEKCASLQLLLK